MRTKRYDDDTGKLKEVEENGETVLNIQELRQTVESSNGNPDIKQAMLKIIDYLEQEG